MTDITELARSRLDFTQPLETESGEPVKYVCHDVIEYKCARVCVDVETGVVYSSPYVGLKIRNVSKYTAVRKFTEEAALAYHEYEQGWISDMKCGDRSHEFLSFVRDPKNILALVEALEKSQDAATQQGNIACALLDEVTLLRRHADEKSPELRALLIEADSELEALRQRIVELEDTEQKLSAANVTLDARAELAERQLAEMESRTVTVKLPDDEDGQAYGFGKWSNGKLPATTGTMTIAYCEDAWRAAFEVFSSVAGIKVEVESWA